MGELRRFSRHLRTRSTSGPGLVFLAAAAATAAAALLAFLNLLGRRSASQCAALPASRAASPDLMFVSLADERLCARASAALARLHVSPRTCVLRLYAATEPDYVACVERAHGLCAGGCRVDVRYTRGLRMWGDVGLQDVAARTTVVFLRAGAVMSARALEWLELAHRAVETFYARGGRRDVVGAAVGCFGEQSLAPWWAHPAGVPNTTCAFSPVRVGREDFWAFFVAWFGARRREWVSWPHVWNEEIAVPTFWKGKTRTKRDGKLIKFSEATGTDHAYVGDAQLMWERWYPRWAVNYTMRVLPAEGSMGLTVEGAQVREVESELPAVRNGEGRGMYSTDAGDVVRLGDVWYEPVDGEYGEGYFRALQNIVGTKPGMVSLTIVNSKFIALTRSWLCNVQAGGFVPPNIFWIALDEESKEFLKQSGVGETVDVTDALTAENMDAVNIIYGQPAYWKLMLMRTRLIRDLLDRGIDVFLFETDQVWLQDPFPHIKRELEGGADMVGTLDTQHNVAGNTLLLQSVLPTRRMWGEVYHRFKMSYDSSAIDAQEKHSNTFVRHDQHQLSALLLYDTEFTQDFPVALGLLNAQKFVGGSWYSGLYTTEESRRPIIINNNFISGTEKKKARAQIFGHWFVGADGETCDNDAVQKALRYEFVKLPGKWWAREQRKLITDWVK